MQLQVAGRESRSRVGLIVPLNFKKHAVVSVPRRENRQAKTIAEAVILQSMEDLYERRHKQESIEFFNGSGFELCAQIAGLSEREKTEILGMVKKAGIETDCAIAKVA